MPSLIDISTPIAGDIAVWPDRPGVQIRRFLRLEAGDAANASTLEMDVHCGRHINAPAHMLPEAATMESISLDRLVGAAVVVAIDTASVLDAAILEQSVPRNAARVLLKTRNSTGGTNRRAFDADFCALSADGAQWLVEHDVDLVGIDYLSIQRFLDGPETHEILLTAGIVIVEGLDLADVVPGRYELICLPLALPGLEAAPARAALRVIEEQP